MLRLNLGAGGNIKPNEDGWVNIDARDLPGIDIVMNIMHQSLPYTENAIDEINMQDFLEHLPGYFQKDFLTKLHTLLKPGGGLYIQIPHLKVLAARYLDIMENPTELQHPLTAEKFAQALYGGQEYAENFHQWGYDEGSLKKMLNEVGFAVRRCNSDGGQNLLCQAYKPTEAVYIPVGGGLGDVIQVYLSSPKHHDSWLAYPNDEFPTTDTYASLWFRRLQHFKNKHPNIKVQLICQSHNKATRELFTEHPHIDEIIDLEWDIPKLGDETKWTKPYNGAENISTLFNYADYEVDGYSVVYLIDDEVRLIQTIKELGEFILVHPFAGGFRDTMLTRSKWIEIVDELLTYKNVVVVGSGRDSNLFDTDRSKWSKNNKYVSLANRASVRVSTELAIQCNGFVGTHSAMILPAWFGKAKSVCIVPPNHDGGQPWEEFFASDNPTTWGADKPFNKTIIVREQDEIDIQEVVDWVL